MWELSLIPHFFSFSTNNQSVTSVGSMLHLFPSIVYCYHCYHFSPCQQYLCDDYYCFLTCISSVQSLSGVWLFETPWTAARQASLSNTSFWNLFKLMSIESVMPSNHLILCCPHKIFCYVMQFHIPLVSIWRTSIRVCDPQGGEEWLP